MALPVATNSNSNPLGRSLIEFRPGAFTPGLPVQPVVIKYPHEYCNPASPRAGQSLALKLFRLASQFVNYLDVTFLPVYQPTPEEVANPAQYGA